MAIVSGDLKEALVIIFLVNWLGVAMCGSCGVPVALRGTTLLVYSREEMGGWRWKLVGCWGWRWSFHRNIRSHGGLLYWYWYIDNCTSLFQLLYWYCFIETWKPIARLLCSQVKHWPSWNKKRCFPKLICNNCFDWTSLEWMMVFLTRHLSCLPRNSISFTSWTPTLGYLEEMFRLSQII